MKTYLFLLKFLLPLYIFAADEPILYILNGLGPNVDDGYISKFNIDTKTLETATFGDGVVYFHSRIMLSNDRTKIYISSGEYGPDAITVFSTTSEPPTLIGSFGQSPDLNLPEGLAFNKDGTKLYVGNFTGGITTFDIDQNTGMGTNPDLHDLNLESGLYELIPNRDKTLLYAVTRHTIYVLNMDPLSILATYDLTTYDSDPSASMRGSATSSDNKLYVTERNSGKILVFEWISGSLELRIDEIIEGPGVLHKPEDVFFSPDEKLLYIVNSTDAGGASVANTGSLLVYDFSLRQLETLVADGNGLSHPCSLAPGYLFGSEDPGDIPNNFPITNVQAFCRLDNFFSGSCFWNEIRWILKTGSRIDKYNIYKKESDKFLLVKTINEGTPTVFTDYDIKLNSSYTYVIECIVDGKKFFEKTVVIKTKKK